MLFTARCSYHTVPQLVRGRKRESSPRAGWGNLPVRFDEREQEAGPSQSGLRERGESRVTYPTGRLKSLRLFSTLLPASLIGWLEESTSVNAFYNVDAARVIIVSMEDRI